MEREFVSYEQAVALKELWFDEECLATYVGEVLDLTLQTLNDDYFTVAPLKQQVFRWFREKYKCYANLSIWIHEEGIGIYHEFEIYIVKKYSHGSISYKTYEEAENACIDKLIELAKQQNNGK